MTKHLSGPAVLFAIGIGFANACGVADALRDSSGPLRGQRARRRRIHLLPDRDRSAARGKCAPAVVDGVPRLRGPGVRPQRTGAGPPHLQDSRRRQRGERRDGDDGRARQNRLHALIRARHASVTFNGEGGPSEPRYRSPKGHYDAAEWGATARDPTCRYPSRVARLLGARTTTSATRPSPPCAARPRSRSGPRSRWRGSKGAPGIGR